METNVKLHLHLEKDNILDQYLLNKKINYGNQDNNYLIIKNLSLHFSSIQ